jgi:hypothetical protein
VNALLIVPQALQYSRSITEKKTAHLRSIYVSTYGIIFLGTPHTGAETAKMGNLLHKMANAMIPGKLLKSEPQLINALQMNSETLQNINVEFTNFQKRFNLFFFHETQRTSMMGMEDYVRELRLMWTPGYS